MNIDHHPKWFWRWSLTSEHSSDLHFALELVGNWGSGAGPAVETWIEAGASWKYLDNGSNLGTAWRASGFNDATWASGAAILGYGDGHEATTVSYGSDPNNKYITTYFRKSFTIGDPALYDSFEISATVDDGLVIYLNGVELARGNMPSGTISYTTRASTAIEDTSQTQSFAAAGWLQAGT
ncbi:MAG TPA: hypothetical protein VHO48_11340, partial [Anaerolineaceae bacterium]|nr:hypothetical protein [Anaerolineaceae bacterium]